MNVPAIVRKSFEELRNNPQYIAIVNFVVNGLGKMTSPIDRARFIHHVVDEHNREVFSHPLVKQLSPCQMGCSACCYTQVSVTEDEAQLLVKRINDGFEIDLNLLKLQMKAGNDSVKFFDMKYQDRRCVFLNSNEACGIYEDRPSVCRTNVVLGTPEQCDTSHGIQPTRLVKTPKSDMAIYGSYLSASKSGSLPYLVGDLLGVEPFLETD